MKHKPDTYTHEQRVADSKLTQRKLVRVADEDDDRSLWARDANGHLSHLIYANPKYEELQNWLGRKKLYAGGWYPAINIRLRTMERDYKYAADFAGFQGCAGFFEAFLSCRNGVWRVACWGNDDTSHEKINLTELQAKRIYDRLKDHITIRSLYNKLGFGGQY